MTNVYVLSKEGKPLIPTVPAIARLILKEKKAKVFKKMPFTIKMLVDTTEYTQEVVAGMDTGSKTIGSAAITNGKVVYQAEIKLRNDVSKKMQQRKMYRRTRRSRKTRYRKARWLNRASSRKEGRLSPSIRSKIDSHLKEKDFIESILPVTKWKVELASFDIHKITNPNVEGKDYQEGVQKDYYNVKAYILDRDGYQCQKCKTKKDKLHVHHIVFRSKGGTDTPSNLITLCEGCHDKLHQGLFEIKGSKSKTKHATEMGIIKSQLKKRFGVFEETYGYETKFKREQILGISKTHYNDAVAICYNEGEQFTKNSNIVYLKRSVPKGDYQQTRGKRSEIKIPTRKLFGFRKFDLIKTSKETGFVKGKRVTGFFVISDINGNIISEPSVKKNCKRITARNTILIERKIYE
jgi:hypothetical protein